MKLKIFKKLFFTTSCVLFVTLTLVFVLLSIAINDEFADNKYSVINSSTESIENLLKDDVEITDKLITNTVRTLSEVNELDIYLVDHIGRILVCGCDNYSDNAACIHTNTILGEEFLSGISYEGKLELSSIDGMYERMNYTSSKKVIVGADTQYFIIAVSQAMSAGDLIKMMLGIYAISAIFPIIFMFVAQYSVVYRITRPLKYMSIAAKSIANGDFSKRVPVISDDEIGELSLLFNRMIDSLSRTEKTGKTFIANVSHELKTPMTTISGFIDGILDGTIDDSKRDYYLNIVSQEIRRLSRLVQSMLSMSKLESGEDALKYSNFKISDTILNIVLSMEQAILSKNIDIFGLDELSETNVYGDRDLLHQVFYNLTDNAVKFTDEGGRIEFYLHRIDNHLEFKIRNTGEGIPDKDIPHIFERFYKIDKSRSSHKESLGLGLYICKTIVELHNGRILVDSKIGEYTEFTVMLPIDYDK